MGICDSGKFQQCCSESLNKARAGNKHTLCSILSFFRYSTMSWLFYCFSSKEKNYISLMATRNRPGLPFEYRERRAIYTRRRRTARRDSEMEKWKFAVDGTDIIRREKFAYSEWKIL